MSPDYRDLHPINVKVLFLNPEYPPIGGGGANATFHILQELANEPGLSITLVTSSETGKFYRLRIGDNIEVHRLPLRKESLYAWKQTEMLTYTWRAYWHCRKLMSRERYDLCHAFFGFPSGVVSYALRRRIPYIVSLRGSDVPGFNERFSLHYIPLIPIFIRIWRGARYVIANSEGLRDLALRTDSSQPISVIPNGVDTRMFHPGELRNNGAIELVTVCRFVGRKGIPYLIQAMSEIRSRNPNVHLSIIGDGEKREEWTGMVKELQNESCITFAGHLDHDALAAALRNADVFVLPSLYEGMSNTLLEAVASGLPVIVTDTGGTRELVGDNGVVVAQRDPGAIARAVLELASCESRRIEMGRRSSEIARRFTWKSVAQQYAEVYRRVAAEANAGPGPR